MEVSVDKEEEYQPNKYFKRKIEDHEIEPMAGPQRTSRAP